MIYIYTGKTGSGKTYNMIRDVYWYWAHGTDLYSNTKLLFDKDRNKNILENPECFTIYEKSREKLASVLAVGARKKERRPLTRGNVIYFEDISELLEVRNGIIVMDEAQNLLEARNWESLPFEFSNKLRQHRKHQLDLYGTAQNMGTIDINLRRLVQKWSHCREVFALFGKRNPSWFTWHTREYKDIDMLYNQVDDLQVPALKTTHFFIHPFKRRLYDTLYDIGFTKYKTLWLQQNKKKKILILPKTMSLTSARTQLLLLKHFLDQTRSENLKSGWRN